MEDVERDGYLVAAADLVSGRAEVGAAVADLDRVKDQILADPEDEAQSEIIYKDTKSFMEEAAEDSLSQCDQMATLFLNIWPFTIMEICLRALKICQSLFKFFPKTN